MIEYVTIPIINQAFDAIGKTPLDPNRVKLKSYGERKLRQLQASVRETLHMNKPKDDFEEILGQLKVRFKDATRSEKIQILTILPKNWSIRQIEQKFKVTHWMAQTAKNLQVERGVMASPNPKPGRKLNGDLIKSIHDFYLSDTVSRVMPGIKDYVFMYSPEEERESTNKSNLCFVISRRHINSSELNFLKLMWGSQSLLSYGQNNVFWLEHPGHTVYASALYTRMSNLC